MTPMMSQYQEIRKKLPKETLLFFRLGDFYELFEEDAVTGAQILGLTLTKRQTTPMAGIPYHAAANYMNKLLNAGKKVAICDQMETPQAGKLVKRSLTRILTPGTLIEEKHLEQGSNHFLLALQQDKKNKLNAAWIDLSTGEFYLASAPISELIPVIEALQCKEILFPERTTISESLSCLLDSIPQTTLPLFAFDPQEGEQALKKIFQVNSLEGFGIPQKHPAIGTAGALIYYARETLCTLPNNLRKLTEYRAKKYLLLDPATQRNLEIFRSSSHTREGSLLRILDATVTAAGTRLLEDYLRYPLIEVSAIQERQERIKAFLQDSNLLSALKESLKNIRDIPRLLGRIQNRGKNPRDLGSLRDTLQYLPTIKQILESFHQEALSSYVSSFYTFEELAKDLNQALNTENLPITPQEGNFIRDGYDTYLDEFRSLLHGGQTWLLQMEQEEQIKTGIKNLRIRFNDVFGYFIEVSKSNLYLVPPHYIRKQTLVNAERFYTEALKEKETGILRAETEAIGRENEILELLIEKILQEASKLYALAQLLAEVDVFAGWAQITQRWNYCCPTINTSEKIQIVEGRHPILERILNDPKMAQSSMPFIPNDTQMDSERDQVLLLTGPNMGGKSTYIRQVALITLMAHIGSWVPAKTAEIGIVDRIFSRIGANDELHKGYSTFMVEMNETANIIHNVTPRSLIILDEIGRGTSTYDGLSIAWAIIEHLHGTESKGPKVLFATHYHEITQLAVTLPRLKNYCVAVKEWNKSIIFLHQIVPGSADQSYGIHVARLAGIPETILQRAQTVLKTLESQTTTLPKRSFKIRTEENSPAQLHFF